MAEYIEREAAKAAIKKRLGTMDLFESRFNADIDAITAADVAPVVHGTWEERDDGWGGTYYHCSACGEDWCTIEGTPVENSMKYCPHCGAKMDQEEDKA